MKVKYRLADKELIMYSRSTGCPMVSLAKRVLDEHQITYREIMIDRDKDARERVLDWTGFLSVPTLVIAENGDDFPYTQPVPLESGNSPRGIDRGAMITEPGVQQFVTWLKKHELIG